MMDNFKQTSKKGKSMLGGSTLVFFVLVYLLTIPFWVLGAVTGFQLMPGLPVAALSTICPMLAALILVYFENRKMGVVALLKRAFDFKRIANVWYVPILLIMPVVMLLSFGVMRITGMSVPTPIIRVMPTIVLGIVFLIGALGEELGWSGYAIDPMQKLMGTFRASIVLGMVWAVYHYVALAQAHRSVEWIAWWSLGTVAERVIIVWIYNNTNKSVFATALLHMMINVTWQLFPISGSYYDPRITSIIVTLIAVTIVVLKYNLIHMRGNCHLYIL